MGKHTLVILGSSADRSGVDVDVPVAVGETTVAANGAPGTATVWYPKFKGSIVQAFANSETAAAADIRFRKTSDPYWNHLYETHLQTVRLGEEYINVLNYPIDTGDSIECDGTNGGAVLDVVGLYVTEDGRPAVSTKYPENLPPGTMLVEATGATTLTADQLSPPGTITFVDWTPQRDVIYRIYGMSMNGATACASRLHFLEGPYAGKYYPGVIAAYTAAAMDQMFYGDFGEFKGQTPPMHQTIGVAGDTAQVFKFLIAPVSGGK